MPIPTFTAADYLSALQALMPRGRVWPREADAVMTLALAGLAPVYERSGTRAAQVMAEAFPPSTYELLPEWESSLGLPDACAGTSLTTQARRASVVSRFVGLAGQRASDYIGVAASLGYTVTVTMFAQFRMGQTAMGAPLGAPDWAHTWAIEAPLDTITPFRMGQSSMGDPLQAWGNALLECELAALAPPHTVLQFRYH
ncbi:MAG: DUF2313 domain-containing protein [Magnetospirillum sp.]|nr:DUF2313 domain-containing protein [Magnetospirillum sp.]